MARYPGIVWRRRTNGCPHPRRPQPLPRPAPHLSATRSHTSPTSYEHKNDRDHVPYHSLDIESCDMHNHSDLASQVPACLPVLRRPPSLSVYTNLVNSKQLTSIRKDPFRKKQTQAQPISCHHMTIILIILRYTPIKLPALITHAQSCILPMDRAGLTRCCSCDDAPALLRKIQMLRHVRNSLLATMGLRTSELSGET